MRIRVLKNDRYKICCVADGSTDDLLVFLNGLGANQEKSQAGMLVLLENAACDPNGPRNWPDSLSHQIDAQEGIFEFIKGRIRVLWFYDAGKMVICAHGFLKDSQKTPPERVGRAIDIKKRYLQAKATNTLVLVSDEET